MSARLRLLLISALLAAAVLAVYAPVAGYDFIALDDAQYVKDNANINSGFSWQNVKWAFENVVSGNWHPVTMLSHMADCQVYGPYPGGQHFTNLLLHVANTLLLFWVLFTMIESRKAMNTRTKDQKQALGLSVPGIWPCALVAALFGLHPLHVESVAWISERKDVLSAFFGLLTLLLYTLYVKKTGLQSPMSKIFYCLALVMFALGLMSKSMLVTLPFVMLLLDFWPLQRVFFREPKVEDSKVSAVSLFNWRLAIEKIPFILLAVIFSVITFFVQKDAGAVVSLKHFPLEARLGNAMVSYAHYLAKTFWPDPLAMLYPYHRWTPGQVAASTVLFLGLSFVAIKSARRRPYIFVGWFWFTGMLVPVIGLVQVGLQAMADHYTYLPLIGIFITLAWGLADILEWATPPRQPVSDRRQSNSINHNQPAFIVLGAVLVVSVTAVSAKQVHYWKNSETLFEHAVRATDSNTVAHYILGALFDSQGKTDEASYQFTRAIEDDPGNIKARCGLGYILCNQGDLDEAAGQYQAALRFAPDSAKAHFGLAEVLMKQHEFDEAISEYSLALQYNPDIAEAHYQLAALSSIRGDATSAISHLQEAVRLDPDWPPALNNLAWILATQPDEKFRNGPEAMRLAMRAVILTGKNNPNTMDTLAAAYAETGRFKDAVLTADCAIQNASAAGQTNLAAEIKSRLKLYQSQQPYRE